MRLYTNTMLDWVYNPVISGWYIPIVSDVVDFIPVYNPVISGWYIPRRFCALYKNMVYNPVISGWYIPSTGIQFPKALVVASDPTNQPTEYSCFRDDQASPQALIPVIPSVLASYCVQRLHTFFLTSSPPSHNSEAGKMPSQQGPPRDT